MQAEVEEERRASTARGELLNCLEMMKFKGFE